MEYREFIDQIKTDLPKQLAGTLEEAAVTEAHVNRLQGLSYDGISIVPKGSTVEIIMNLQPYFQMLNNGMTYEDVVERIMDTAAEAYADRPEIQIESFSSYENIKDKLMVQLIGKEGNEEMIHTIPHHSMEDMEIVYRLRIQDTEMGRASALVTNAMLEYYGITEEQLRQDAFISAEFHEPFEIKTIAEVINELIGAEVLPKDELPVYVASNRERMNGAGVIAYPGFMDEAAKQLGGGFYILPSSIHEVILVPDGSEFSAAALQDIVQIVNKEQIKPEDKLSDHVYHYDSKTKMFELSEKYESRKISQEHDGKDGRHSVLSMLHTNQKDCAEKPHKGTAVLQKDETSL